MNTGEVVNQLLQAISELNAEEAAYWCRVLLNRAKREAAALRNIPVDRLIPGFAIDDSGELSGLLAELIVVIVKDEDVPVLLERFGPALEEGLKTDSLPTLQALCLELVLQHALGRGFDVPERLKTACLQCLFCENVGISAKVVEALKTVSPALVEKSLLCLDCPADPVARFRFMEALLVVGQQGGESQRILQSFLQELKSLLQATASTDQLLPATASTSAQATASNDPLLPATASTSAQATASNDPLLLATALQTVSDCVQNREAFVIMQQNGIIQILSGLLAHSDAVVVSRTVDFFSQCAVNNCLSQEEATCLAQKFQIILEEACGNVDVKSSVIFAVCAFAAKDELLDSVASMMEDVMDGLVHGHSSIQLAALHGLGIVFKDAQLSEPKLALLKRLSAHLSEPIFSWVGKRALSNFEEQKNAAYFCLQGLLSTPQGLKLALDTSPIVAELLNRELDGSLLGAKWKYGILEMFAKKPQLFALLNEPIQQQVLRYLGQGVVFRSVATRVAFDPAQ